MVGKYKGKNDGKGDGDEKKRLAPYGIGWNQVLRDGLSAPPGKRLVLSTDRARCKDTGYVYLKPKTIDDVKRWIGVPDEVAAKRVCPPRCPTMGSFVEGPSELRNLTTEQVRALLLVDARLGARAADQHAARIGRVERFLEVEHTDIWNGDYLHFEAKDYACAGVYEAYDNPHYHRTKDTAGRIDFHYLREVVKTALAAMCVIGRRVRFFFFRLMS